MAENEKVNEIVDEIKEKVGEAAEDVKEAYEKASVKAQEKIDEIKKEIDDYTPEQDPEDVQKNKVMAVLAYLGVLVLIPMFLANKSRYAKFHTNQGVILLVIEIVACLLGYIPVIRIIGRILGILTFVFAIIGIINAVKGEAKELPYIGHFRFIK